MISAGGEKSVNARTRSGWKKFEFLPSLKGQGMCQKCHAVWLRSETWEVKEADLLRLERNDMRTIR